MKNCGFNFIPNSDLNFAVKQTEFAAHLSLSLSFISFYDENLRIHPKSPQIQPIRVRENLFSRFEEDFRWIKESDSTSFRKTAGITALTEATVLLSQM